MNMIMITMIMKSVKRKTLVNRNHDNNNEIGNDNDNNNY